MSCMCGDSDCPSCGLAQGTLDETEKLRAEVERLKREAQDARRAAMEEAATAYARGVGDGARLLPKVVAHVRVTFPAWPEADCAAEAIDAMQPGSNSSDAFFVVGLLEEAAAIRAAAKGGEAMSERCEWNPTKEMLAINPPRSTDCQNEATFSVGSGSRNMHLCESCAALFPRLSKKPLRSAIRAAREG